MLSHDEATYFVIAREIFQGKIYFVDLIDTKPIGIFLILGVIIRFISKSIFVIRLITALNIALTAFIVYKISLLNHGERKPAIASGVILIFFLSVFTYFGLFVNPELFFLLFTALGFYFYIHSERILSFFACGFMLGIGFMIKYVVLFDLGAFLLYYFLMKSVKGDLRLIIRAVFRCLAAVSGFLIPISITFLYYYRIGHLNEFIFYTFKVTSQYPVERTFIQTLIFVGDFHLRFFPIIFFFYYTLIRSHRKPGGEMISKGLIITWCLMILIVVLLPGKSFFHYFIQMMLPVSIYSGNFFSEKLVKPAWINKITGKPYGPVILFAVIVINVAVKKLDYYDKPDKPLIIADYLKMTMQPGDRLYTGNSYQILYYLLEKECPVKYVHRTLMCAGHHQKLLHIDLPKEMGNLMKQNIEYIIMSGSFCYEPMNQYIKDNYTKIRSFDGNVQVYRRHLKEMSSVPDSN
jgi:4-amino-4-deoxy-L-arabinose transferase-like glycosyltransferase